MINPVQTSINGTDGSDRYVIIAPLLIKDGAQGFRGTGVFKIYKDAFGDETRLFTEPLESVAPADDLPEEQNPDYLGELHLDKAGNWQYHGDLLNANEQGELAHFILSYEEPDI
jgi:hypothetical protein